MYLYFTQLKLMHTSIYVKYYIHTFEHNCTHTHTHKYLIFFLSALNILIIIILNFNNNINMDKIININMTMNILKLCCVASICMFFLLLFVSIVFVRVTNTCQNIITSSVKNLLKFLVLFGILFPCCMKSHKTFIQDLQHNFWSLA